MASTTKAGVAAAAATPTFTTTFEADWVAETSHDFKVAGAGTFDGLTLTPGGEAGASVLRVDGTGLVCTRTSGLPYLIHGADDDTGGTVTRFDDVIHWAHIGGYTGVWSWSYTPTSGGYSALKINASGNTLGAYTLGGSSTTAMGAAAVVVAFRRIGAQWFGYYSTAAWSGSWPALSAMTLAFSYNLEEVKPANAWPMDPTTDSLYWQFETGTTTILHSRTTVERAATS